ncbi:TPA: ATP-binding protein [Flavobacterium psychrophilum]|uniref:ATP-binding protein n=2 Tax=Flavobacterium psychrophilum TaxID=96345 RepID=UPI000B7C3F8F|nr:ATP-binding protein [Flavobacterium psychrophilum]SNB96717.1 Transcriptional Regulator [Flavobacterium psychrophilum]GEJ29289.1 ATP-dependent DNA helicase [Flavobacterium psychrophilum]GEJ32466.1 ATP-dependent DNA helicase [Flavobacterium psychrophilum]GEJ33013.1 ATP-dependent DNA helicase [Flavobacterium psychrophilum]GEJ39716.1 ATP-dependent DNA helicase [Flavobacterium psychrophilum]
MEEGISIDYKSLKKVVDTAGKLKSEGLRDLAVTSVAFANVHGGKIVIGIEDKDKQPPVNQTISVRTANDTVTRLKSLCFNVGFQLGDIENHANGSQFFTITVYPTLKSVATTADGKIYIRIGDQSQPARSEDIVRLASEKDAFQWELQPRNVTYTEIPEMSMRWFADEIRKSDRVKQNIKDLTDIEIIEHYNLIDKGKLTNLGVLWLGTASQRSRLVYPLTVQYIVYDDLEKKIRKEDWQDYSKNPKELLLEIEKEAIELTYYDEFPLGLFRNKIRHYDARLIRELLINAIAHKSYTISGDIFIKVYQDRLEITNPGGLPLGITKDNILHTTYRRNPHLIRILHDLKLMEGEGTGYNLIYEITSRDAKAFPIPISDYNATSVTQYSKILDEEAVLLLDFIAKNYQLSQKEFIALGVITRHKKILATQLTKELQLTDEDRLRSYISKLSSQSIIINRGEKKGREYLVNPKLIASSKINIKPTLKTIEQPRLKALIEEVLKMTPNISASTIHSKIGDVAIADVRKCIFKMVKEEVLDFGGANKNRVYFLAKKR